ncbi:MAG: citramalate synthase, partial [Verrucomicrobia bacterium]|nr:citramalate synthase [Verrucomicrobiota bacterium]
DGDGPVNALDSALRKALMRFYPAIAKVVLTDFRVRILDPEEATAAKTQVIIESSDGADSWGTVGVSENIIEASWEALVDSVEYKLFRDEDQARSPGP